MTAKTERIPMKVIPETLKGTKVKPYIEWEEEQWNLPITNDEWVFRTLEVRQFYLQKFEQGMIEAYYVVPAQDHFNECEISVEDLLKRIQWSVYDALSTCVEKWKEEGIKLQWK